MIPLNAMGSVKINHHFAAFNNKYILYKKVRTYCTVHLNGYFDFSHIARRDYLEKAGLHILKTKNINNETQCAVSYLQTEPVHLCPMQPEEDPE